MKPKSLARHAGLGLIAFVGGLGLYVGCIAIATNYYSERWSNPWWLTSLWALAVALMLFGLGLVLVAAVRGARRFRTRRLV